jgi:hypothetical protein
MTVAFYINSIVGLDSVATPNQSLSYMMATVDDPRVFNDEMNFQGDSSIQGFAHHSDRRAALPQAPAELMTGAFGTTVDGNLEWIMAVDDDPRSGGGKFIHTDRHNNAPSNYPPQLGG